LRLEAWFAALKKDEFSPCIAFFSKKSVEKKRAAGLIARDRLNRGFNSSGGEGQ
jgi:hypothetical protein